MATPDVHTLTGAYAADALTDIERQSFEQHMGACADCLEEVRTLRETVAVLGAAAAVLPPPALRARVLAEVALTAQYRPGLRTAAERRPGARRWPLAVAASVAMVLAIALGGVGWVQTQRAEEARETAARISAIAADPRGRRVSGPATGGGTVTVLAAGDQGVVLAEGLPELPDSRTYQLWFVRAGGNAITSAGLGPAGEDGGRSWSRFVTGVRAGDTVAVSVEPGGGSQQPTTEPIVGLST
jgi:anti-sigma-K factor RskA